MKTVPQVKEELERVVSLFDPLLAQYKSDERKSVRKLVQSCERRIFKHEETVKQYEEMLSFEKGIHSKGIKNIAGIDEVGRGCIAGPVVAAAVILPFDFLLYGINDSKKLSSKVREQFFEIIKKEAVSYGIGIVSPEIIDKINIYEAAKLSMLKGIHSLAVTPEYLLVDAMKLSVEIAQSSIIKGDERSVSIAAASIIAKVTRDKIMDDYALLYPHYGFEKNKGYGTDYHLQAIAKYGLTPIHRLSFAPCQNS